jgi:two-component system, NarL family, nitrate/nitrite response regulator NarL
MNNSQLASQRSLMGSRFYPTGAPPTDVHIQIDHTAAMRLLVTAPDPLARAGLVALLADQPQVETVGQAAPDEDLLASSQAYQPAVILWDLGWNPDASVDQLAKFVEELPSIVALVADEGAAAAIWASGVRGLLAREVDGTTLAAGLVAVAQGLWVLDPALAGGLTSALAPRLDEAPVEALTPRELEVLHGLAAGLANKEIARRLEISDHTVKFHVNAILGKLGAQSRTEAVVRATRAGLIYL